MFWHCFVLVDAVILFLCRNNLLQLLLLPHFDRFCICIYIYIYVYLCVHIHVCM